MMNWAIARQRLILVLCVATAWIVVGRIIPGTHVQKEVALWIDPRELILERLDAESAFVHRVWIVNQSRNPVQIDRFRTPCECVDVQPNTMILAAGERRQLNLGLKLAIPRHERPGSADVPVRMEFTAMLGGGEPAQSWALVGSVRRPFVTSESNVWIGSRSQGSMEIPIRSVQVRSTQPLRDVNAHCDPPWVTVRLSEIDGSDGEWTVELRSDKPLPPAGIFTGDVVLTAVTPTGKPVSVPVLKYATEMTHDVVARPNAIAVSSHETAGSIEHCLVLKSLSGQSFDVVEIESGIDTNVAVNRDSDSSEPHRHVYKLNLGGRFDRTRVKTLTFRISEHASGSTYPIPVEVTIVHGISGSAGNSFRSEP